MTGVVFHGPPQTQKNATLYQQAKETLRLGQEVRDTLQAFDNQDSIDLNSQPGKVVTAGPQPVRLRYDLAGAASGKDFHSLRGELIDGNVVATLGGRQDSVRLTYRESEQQLQVAVEHPASRGYNYHPGTIRVTQDKLNGSLTVEQEQPFPWAFAFGPGLPEQEARFPAEGPVRESEAAFYTRGLAFQANLEKKMEALKALDNGPRDLNPAPGLVVVAGWERVSSDNLVQSHMAGSYSVPAEAMLRFDPKSGESQEFSLGFGDHRVLEYQRKGETEVFQRRAFLAFDRLEVEADGSRFQQHLKSARMDGKVELYQSEHQVTTGFWSRFLQPKNLASALAMGAIAGTVAALLLPGGLLGGLLVAGASAGSLGALRMPPPDLRLGINRFSGKDATAKEETARQAFDGFVGDGSSRSSRRVEFPQGTGRAEAVAFLQRQSSPYQGDELVILSANFGESGEPALIRLPKDQHYAVQAQEQGLELPGGKLIAYASIRAMGEGRFPS